MKKRIGMILLLSVILASCGSETASSPAVTAAKTDPVQSETETQTEDPYPDDLPDTLSFEGETFDIYTYQGGNLAETTGRNYYNLAVHEENGDVLNDAGYRVTREVEDRLGITLTCTEASSNEIMQSLRKQLLAGDDTFEIAMPFTLENFMPLLSENLLYDVSALKYVDLTREYYVRSAVDMYTIAGKVITVTGSYAMQPALPISYLFNKKAAADLDVENMYDLVRNGTWTHDQFIEIIKDTYRDLNGNGKHDADDFYGFQTYEIGLQYLYCSYDGTAVESDGNGFRFGFDTERAVRIVEKIIDLRKDEDAGYYDNWDVFFGGNSLFCFYLSGSDALRDLDFEFGILPVPKLDENQENYRAFSCGGMVIVPANLSNPDMTGAVIEALYATAHKYIPEAIVNQYIEGKLLNSEDDIEMFRLLNSNEVRKYDFARNYDASGGTIQNFALIYNLVKKQSTDILSQWESVRSKVTTAFDELYRTVAEQ